MFQMHPLQVFFFLPQLNVFAESLKHIDKTTCIQLLACLKYHSCTTTFGKSLQLRLCAAKSELLSEYLWYSHLTFLWSQSVNGRSRVFEANNMFYFSLLFFLGAIELSSLQRILSKQVHIWLCRISFYCVLESSSLVAYGIIDHLSAGSALQSCCPYT